MQQVGQDPTAQLLSSSAEVMDPLELVHAEPVRRTTCIRAPTARW